jgi:hypothetical protein
MMPIMTQAGAYRHFMEIRGYEYPIDCFTIEGDGDIEDALWVNDIHSNHWKRDMSRWADDGGAAA